VKSIKVLEMLNKIPKGRVTTYGELARAAKTSPRAVGQIMRHNKWPDKYPCYKVVSSSGKIHGYAGCLSGKSIRTKEKLLKKDGIAIKNGRIVMQRYVHRF